MLYIKKNSTPELYHQCRIKKVRKLRPLHLPIPLVSFKLTTGRIGRRGFKIRINSRDKSSTPQYENSVIVKQKVDRSDGIIISPIQEKVLNYGLSFMMNPLTIDQYAVQSALYNIASTLLKNSAVGYDMDTKIMQFKRVMWQAYIQTCESQNYRPNLSKSETIAIKELKNELIL
ncbi:hypothetical protein GJ496_010470 [Pomphorhynchus laevis]|nr:hypothetical protein GJ496_010470 [Pomphorhynchus laevis]